MNLRYSPLAAAILSALALPSHAETAGEASAAQLPEVTVSDTALEEDRIYTPMTDSVGGRLQADLRDTPQSITVINEAVLDDQAATSLVEALRNVPGITISAGEGGNIGDNINLRGFSARTDVFMDGFRDRGQYSRDVFSLQAVEVLKGPASMLFGRGSTGGVINQVSKRPQLKDESEISVSVGTDDYYRSTFDTNQKLSDTSAARVSAFWQDISYERDTTEKTGFGLAPSFRFGIGTPTEITLSALIQRNDDIPDYGGPLLRAKNTLSTAKPLDIGKRFYGFSTDHFDQNVDVVTLGIRHKLNDKLTLRNQTQFSRVETDASPTPLGAVRVVSSPACSAYTVALSSVPLSCLEAPRQDRDREVKDVSVYNLTDLTARFDTAAVKHTLTTGLEFGKDKYDFARYFWSPTSTYVNLGNPVTVPRGSTGDPSLGQLTNTETETLAAFINEQADLGEHWTVVAGVRWDRFEASSSNRTFPGFTGTVPPASLRNNDSMVSTRGGILFKPTATQTYYLSYGTSFNPSAEGVTQSAGNFDLDPEENRSYEAGAKWTFMDEALMVNTAAFRIEKTNARTGPNTDQSLEGNIRVDGAELTVTGQITPDWQMIAGYTFLNSEVRDSLNTTTVTVGSSTVTVASEGKDFENTPRHSATLWTTYRLTPEWQFGAGATGASSRFVNSFETAEVDSYVRGDAMVAYLQPGYDIRLNVQNVTDELYYETASQGRATAAMGARYILTGTFRF